MRSASSSLLHLAIAFGDERAHDFLRVVEVHLAAKGLDVKRFVVGTHEFPSENQYIAGIQWQPPITRRNTDCESGSEELLPGVSTHTVISSGADALATY